MTNDAGIETLRLPLRPLARPAEDVVDVWLVRQDRLPLAGLGMLAATTDGDEGRRMLRMQQRFLLRLLLGAYLDRPGRDVAIEKATSGKPVLAGAAGRELGFSQSHTGPWFAIAVTAGAAVGVDIEPADRTPRWQKLARRYFPAEDAETLCADESNGCRRFLDHWTAREALVKAAGRTLAGSVGGIRLGSRPADRPQALPDDWPEPDCWRLSAIDAQPALIGHVAWAGPQAPTVRLRQLEAPDADSLRGPGATR